MLLLMLLLATPAGAAEAPSGAAACQDAYQAVAGEWRAAWPAWPAVKPGNAMITDSKGHRHTLAEYEGMLRRLREGHAACDRHEEVAADDEIRLVHGWLNEDPGVGAHHPPRLAQGD